ncbi:hypothetical protein [Nitrosomonas sp.]|uniref:hypothetical protein n=1 Tax=Nitrosomonas sp. TaxID=42353 RepID=UPI001DF37D11|nr:hypothetical protein [Nitrosomonas sp.]MBX3616981.1 hypothetical protein [Nitrosomonas sp.]
MVNENFTNINKLTTAEIETDPFDQAFILLTRAHGMLDALFTLENCGNSTESLCKGSLAATLDAAMASIKEAQELLLTKK